MPLSFLTAFITVSFKVIHLFIIFKYAHTISNFLITAVSIFFVLFKILEPVLWQHILKLTTPLFLIRCKTMLHIYNCIMLPFSPPYSSAWFPPSLPMKLWLLHPWRQNQCLARNVSHQTPSDVALYRRTMKTSPVPLGKSEDFRFVQNWRNRYSNSLGAGRYGVRILVLPRDIYLRKNVQNGSLAHPA